MMKWRTLCTAVALTLMAGTVIAAKPAPYAIDIHDDHFEPETLTVPGGTRVKIAITNHRSVPAEFESSELNREKVVPAGTTMELWLGPLKPGRYRFFDDFNPRVTGWIVVPDGGHPR